MLSYGSISFVILGYLLIRVWVLHGRKIPLIFIGILVLGNYALPEVLGPYRFSIFVSLLAIVLLLIDRFKSVRWQAM